MAGYSLQREYYYLCASSSGCFARSLVCRASRCPCVEKRASEENEKLRIGELLSDNNTLHFDPYNGCRSRTDYATVYTAIDEQDTLHSVMIQSVASPRRKGEDGPTVTV